MKKKISKENFKYEKIRTHNIDHYYNDLDEWYYREPTDSEKRAQYNFYLFERSIKKRKGRKNGKK